MIKIRSNFKLCGEDTIPKFDHLIAFNSFQPNGFHFLTPHNQATAKLNRFSFFDTVKVGVPPISLRREECVFT
jgi:hypothetical protein